MRRCEVSIGSFCSGDGCELSGYRTDVQQSTHCYKCLLEIKIQNEIIPFSIEMTAGYIDTLGYCESLKLETFISGTRPARSPLVVRLRE